MKIVVTGKVNASGGAFVNQTHVATNLRLSSSYPGASGVTLSGGANAYMTVYAPQTAITLSGGAPLFGALLGKTLAASGKSAVHYDVQALAAWAEYLNG